MPEVNPLRIQPPAGTPEAAPGNQLSPWWGQSATDALGQWLAEQHAKSAQMGLWDPATNMPTPQGWQQAGSSVANALTLGTIAPRASAGALIGKLVDRWGAAGEVPYNEEGGQQVDMFLPDGRVSSAVVPDHGMMVREAGIPGSLEDFMSATGVIRSHGPDNYEAWQMPTNQQIRAISRHARNNGHTSVTVDAGPSADAVVSDRVSIGRLSEFFKEAFPDTGGAGQ